jgi:hypothetical protein
MVMDRLLSVIVFLYPRWWREHYGTELRRVVEDLLDDGRSSTRIVLNVAAHGVTERAKELAAVRSPMARTILITSLVLLAGLTVTVIARGSPPSSTSSSVVTSSLSVPDPSIGPAMPAPGASPAQWQQYGAAPRAAVESVNWSTVHPPGCTVTSAVVSPIDGSTPGAPPGVVTDGVTIIGKCSGP